MNTNPTTPQQNIFLLFELLCHTHYFQKLKGLPLVNRHALYLQKRYCTKLSIQFPCHYVRGDRQVHLVNVDIDRVLFVNVSVLKLNRFVPNLDQFIGELGRIEVLHLVLPRRPEGISIAHEFFMKDGITQLTGLKVLIVENLGASLMVDCRGLVLQGVRHLELIQVNLMGVGFPDLETLVIDNHARVNLNVFPPGLKRLEIRAASVEFNREFPVLELLNANLKKVPPYFLTTINPSLKMLRLYASSEDVSRFKQLDHVSQPTVDSIVPLYHQNSELFRHVEEPHSLPKINHSQSDDSIDYFSLSVMLLSLKNRKWQQDISTLSMNDTSPAVTAGRQGKVRLPWFKRKQRTSINTAVLKENVNRAIEMIHNDPFRLRITESPEQRDLLERLYTLRQIIM